MQNDNKLLWEEKKKNKSKEFIAVLGWVLRIYSLIFLVEKCI